MINIQDRFTVLQLKFGDFHSGTGDDFSNSEELLYWVQSLLKQKPNHMSEAQYVEELRGMHQHTFIPSDSQSMMSSSSSSSADSGRGSIASSSSSSSSSSQNSNHNLRSLPIPGPGSNNASLSSNSSNRPEVGSISTSTTPVYLLNRTALNLTPLPAPHSLPEAIGISRSDRTTRPASFIKESLSLAPASTCSPRTNGSDGGAFETAANVGSGSDTADLCIVCHNQKASIVCTPCAHRLCPTCAPLAYNLCPANRCGRVITATIPVFKV